MCNCTPHSSTGFSPYYLMFAREPRLPIDTLLGVEHDSGMDGSSYWLAMHHERLRYAWETQTPLGYKYINAEVRRRPASSPLHRRYEHPTNPEYSFTGKSGPESQSQMLRPQYWGIPMSKENSRAHLRHHDYPNVARNGQHPSTFTYRSENRRIVYRGHAVDRQQPRKAISIGWSCTGIGRRQLRYSGSRGREPIRAAPEGGGAGVAPVIAVILIVTNSPVWDGGKKYTHGSRRRARDWNPSTSDSDCDHDDRTGHSGQSNWSNGPKHGGGHRPYHHARLPPFTEQDPWRVYRNRFQDVANLEGWSEANAAYRATCLQPASGCSSDAAGGLSPAIAATGLTKWRVNRGDA